MPSPACLRAISDAVEAGQALLKFISPNDVGTTGSHQAGYYLPKPAWKMYSPYSPKKGENNDHPVRIIWQDGRTTASIVKWYGVGTRSEYRLTRFGRSFPWLTADSVGDLLVLIPQTINNFNAYVLDLEDDILEVQASLGVEVLGRYAIYTKDIEASSIETEDACLDRHFRHFVAALEHLPAGDLFSSATLDAIHDCSNAFKTFGPDEKLLTLVQNEYTLFKMAERRIFQNDVQRLFKSIDDFLKTALSILNARKARAGRSLENHVAYILREASVPFEARPIVDGTRPDILIPSTRCYNDPAFPDNKLFVAGVKTTCKDRWRQVTKEAPRIPNKHILTLQEGISSAQLKEMHKANVTLVVPEPLHKKYPKGAASIFSLHDFLNHIRRRLS